MALGSITKILGLSGDVSNLILFLGHPILARAVGVVFAVIFDFPFRKSERI